MGLLVASCICFDWWGVIEMERIILETYSKQEMLEGIRRFYIDGIWKIGEGGTVYNAVDGKESHFHVEFHNGVWRFGK